MRDLGSKNGTRFLPLSRDQADQLVLNVVSRGEATATDTQLGTHSSQDYRETGTGGTLLALPALVRASRSFELILS